MGNIYIYTQLADFPIVILACRSVTKKTYVEVWWIVKKIMMWWWWWWCWLFFVISIIIVTKFAILIITMFVNSYCHCHYITLYIPLLMNTLSVICSMFVITSTIVTSTILGAILPVLYKRPASHSQALLYVALLQYGVSRCLVWWFLDGSVSCLPSENATNDATSTSLLGGFNNTKGSL